VGTGDLVEHLPHRSKAPQLKAIYEDWGHEPDFQAGIIIESQPEFALVLPTGTGKKPAWYKKDELGIISAAR